MDRWWLLTWHTYGSWLPGDPRGSVTSVRAGPDPREEHDLPGTPIEPPMAGLYHAARQAMRGEAVWLTLERVRFLVPQWRETARYRGWWLRGVALMANHAHLVVGVPGDPDPHSLVRDFKSYGSRTLNR